VDGLLGRNFLLGTAGDAINAVLAGAGHNLRLLRRWLAELLALVFSWLAAILNPPGPASATRFAF
jgi:IS5 family transposase